MPLNSTAKPAQKHDLLAAVAGSTKIATRSITPQPSVPQNRGRERNLPGFDRHHSRSNSENGFTGAQNPPLRPDDLKIPVRNALAKSASSLPQALAAHSGRAKDVSVKQKLHKSSDHRPGVLDDTVSSIHMDDSTSFGDGGEDTEMAMHYFDNEQLQTFEPIPRPSSNARNRLQQGGIPRFMREVDLSGVEGSNWTLDVDRERQRHGQEPKYNTYHHQNARVDTFLDNEDHDYDDGDADYPDGPAQEWDNTPSRLRPGFETKTEPPLRQAHTQDPVSKPRNSAFPRVNMPDDIPALDTSVGNPFSTIDGANNRFKDRRSHAHAHTGNEATAILVPQPQHNDFSSKVYSYPPSSEEEDHDRDSEAPGNPQPTHATAPNPPPPQGTKRPHDSQLDFPMEVLVKKSFADLDAIAFDHDPARPETSPAIDANGNPMTLTSKLHNLSKMRLEDQTTLFRSLTDPDREATATWFLERIHDEAQKLMRVRIERRKVALRFEMEVKRRDKLVRTKIKDVENDLDGLKTGGSKLIAGRTKQGG